MFNNYFEHHEYQSHHKVYTHATTNNCIYLGDIQAALDIPFIQESGIKTVVTAAVGMDHVAFDGSIQHIVYPLLDMKSENISKLFFQFYQLIEHSFTKGNILVHCAAGISRSSTLVIAYLMKKHNWSFKQAISFLRKNRPSVCPNLGFERQLKEYQVLLKQQNSNRPFQRRVGSKTSQDKKHMASPMKSNVLPEINFMGRTQLKPKVLDLFGQEQSSKESSQRSRRESSDRKNQYQFYGTRRMTFKPLKSKSISERAPLMLSNSPPQQNTIKMKNSSTTSEGIEQVMVRRLHLNEKKVATERQLRIKPLHKVAYY